VSFLRHLWYNRLYHFHDAAAYIAVSGSRRPRKPQDGVLSFYDYDRRDQYLLVVSSDPTTEIRLVTTCRSSIIHTPRDECGYIWCRNRRSTNLNDLEPRLYSFVRYDTRCKFWRAMRSVSLIYHTEPKTKKWDRNKKNKNRYAEVLVNSPGSP